jgi:phage N-6-adenine-methyltransferase
MNTVHFQSDRHTWETPRALFERLNAEFAFTLDVCALPHNAKCGRYFTPDDNGLNQSWSGVCWMNPPYGSEIGKWMEKAFESSRCGCTVVCLVPARVDTEWWHRFVVQGEIRFLRGRLRFVGADSSAPFPSAIVIFRDRWWERRDWEAPSIHRSDKIAGRCRRRARSAPATAR